MAKEFIPVCGIDVTDDVKILINDEKFVVLVGLDASNPDNDNPVVLNLGTDVGVLIKLALYLRHLIEGDDHHHLDTNDVEKMSHMTVHAHHVDTEVEAEHHDIHEEPPHVH